MVIKEIDPEGVEPRRVILVLLRLYSRNITTLFSKYYEFILEVFRLYSRNISTLFSKCFDFILVTFRLFSHSFDFILEILRL